MSSCAGQLAQQVRPDDDDASPASRDHPARFVRRTDDAALDEIAGSMGDKVKIVKLNVDESPKTASKYGVMSIPTLMIFKGGEMASRQVGAAPKAKLQQWISAAV